MARPPPPLEKNRPVRLCGNSLHLAWTYFHKVV